MLINRISKSIVAAMLALLILGTAARAQSDSNPFERGTTAYMVGAYELAIREYSQALISSDNRYQEAIYNIGVCYYELGRKDEAAKWFRSAIKARGGRYAIACGRRLRSPSGLPEPRGLRAGVTSRGHSIFAPAASARHGRENRPNYRA